MSAPASLVEIDGDDRLNARRLAAARALYVLVESFKKECGEEANRYYECHLALGLGRALIELAEGGLVPAFHERLNAKLPAMAEEFFQRAEAIIKAAGARPS